MLETYLEKYHTNILEEFEKFYESSKIVTSTTPAEKPPLLDTVKLKDDSTIESLPEQDANLKLPAPNDFLQDLEWDDIVWDDSLSESTDFDIDQFLDTVLKWNRLLLKNSKTVIFSFLHNYRYNSCLL